MNIFEKIWAFLKDSDHWKHLVGGYAIGLGSDDVYCAAYAGTGVAAALEFKDWQHGDKFDWVDLTVTLVGVAAGYATRIGIKALFR